MSFNKITICAFYGFVLSVALSVGAHSAARAAVITLTGGDPGEGFTPAPGPYSYAYHFANNIVPNPETVQGVVFAPINVTLYGSGYPDGSHPYQLTYSSGEYNGFPIPSLGASANDTSLAAAMREGIFPFGTATITLSGLQAGKAYQIDLFGESNNDSRSGTISFNGLPLDTLNETAGNVYDVREVVVANGSNQIGIILTDGLNDVGQFNNFAIMAVSVSAPVPEPSSIALLGAGAIALLAAIRHRRRS